MSSKITRVVWAIERCEHNVETWKKPTSKHFKKIHDKLLVTTHEFWVSYVVDGVTVTFTIPKGWEFDGASIPRVFWSTIGKPTSSKFRIAAMVHDWLYGVERPMIGGRKTADWLFKWMLEQEGVWSLKTTLMWAAVRVGGHSIYHSRDSVVKQRYLKLKETLNEK